MELEEQWWQGQLAADIHQALRFKELQLPLYKGQSPQLNLRRYFADLIATISNSFRLCPAARHLAVYLLDLFMDRYDVTMQQLHMVSLSCLVLASKFEERDDRVPKLDTLNNLSCMSSMNLILTKQGLLHMELLLLETFQWNLYLPTAAHFIEYYLSIAVHEGDLHDGWPMTCLEKTKRYMAKYAEYFLEVSLQNHVFLSFAPSLVSAACVASSRLVLHLSPTWPPRLQRLTCYTWEKLIPCAEKLLIAHDSDVKEASKPDGQLQQPGQTAFHGSCQAAAVPSYLHRSGMQYSQQAPNSRPAPHLNHSISLQAPNAAQHSNTQAITAMLDPSSNVVNRAYQVSMHYTCAAPCFDR
ncbi:cyclin-J [Thalassophryne amazonica]|uniref:cyclin-J n=1 Tax=Thalassophryne amazonica TaxID=390379 RepID=UPI0014722E49|nr:cyclin-J [Thalassophryne amazonica]